MLLTTISVLTFTLFGALYPLFTWTVRMNQLNRGFHRMTLGLSCIIGGVGVVFVFLIPAIVPANVRIGEVVWLVSLLVVTGYYWNQESIKKWVITIPSIFGVIAFYRILSELISGDIELFMISLLGGFILCGALFSMILGHWYLNVVSLPISMLKSTVKFLILIVALRFIWDMRYIFMGEVLYNGLPVSMTQFLQTFDGFFLIFALFFGTLLPLILGILTLKTIAIQSTQSATGLLYVIVISVVMADLFYKYYLVQAALPL
ncbi:MAG: hypothetical protein QGI16_04070 [Candidatus Marinimicrobia bacterium]|nr:hypothetical protein [Candidatus Neomarinimicrobiota bacterium]MDP6569555.1 hypothetical protein [Candidatus Neomarinimicrobiota bacterium]MDP7026087.1 hypothetical protein [Candidatus Neomarinimicrobiota bacterium]